MSPAAPHPAPATPVRVRGGWLPALALLLLLSAAPLSAQAGDGARRAAPSDALWSFGLGAGLGAGAGNLARSGDPGSWDAGPVVGVRLGRGVAGARFGLLLDRPTFTTADRAGNRASSTYLLAVSRVRFDERAAQVGLGLSYHRPEDDGLLPSSRVGWAVGASAYQALRPNLGFELSLRYGRSSVYSSQLIALQLVRHWSW